MTITLTREEAQQVLDALEAEHSAIYGTSQTVKATELLRTRLAQPEPEPVAWFIEGTYADGTPSFAQVCETDPEFYVPLYTAPPQREWQGLTDEEIDELDPILMKYIGSGEFVIDGQTVDDFARAIEAKLKEKNT